LHRTEDAYFSFDTVFQLAPQSLEGASAVVNRAIQDCRYDEAAQLLERHKEGISHSHLAMRYRRFSFVLMNLGDSTYATLCPRLLVAQLRLLEVSGNTHAYDTLCASLVNATIAQARKRKSNRLSKSSAAKSSARQARDDDDDEHMMMMMREEEREDDDEQDDDNDDDEQDDDDDDNDNDEEDEDEDEEEEDVDQEFESVLGFGISKQPEELDKQSANQLPIQTVEELERSLWNENLFNIIGEEEFSAFLLRVCAMQSVRVTQCRREELLADQDRWLFGGL
jgi:hypothetical protein